MTTSAFQPMDRAPVTLKEAMEVWTLDSVKARIKYDVNYNLVPSADELNGAIPEKNRLYQFELLRDRFFPDPSVKYNPTSVWRVFYEIGYIRTYHRAIKASTNGGKLLKDALDGIFSNLQILPYNPGLPSNTAPLWRWQHSVVTLLVNSSYIQLLDRTIKQTEGEVRGPGHKKLLSAAQLERMLCGDGQIEVQPKRSMAHRRGKSKNWRQPPQRHQHLEVMADLEENDGDMDTQTR